MFWEHLEKILKQSKHLIVRPLSGVVRQKFVAPFCVVTEIWFAPSVICRPNSHR